MKNLSGILLSLFLAFAIPVTQARPVDINQADAKTIAASLKGIGLKKAKAIVAYRQKHGHFVSADDLVKIKGIGKKTVEKNRKDILLSMKKTKAK